jgi:hypothetical protein
MAALPSAVTRSTKRSRSLSAAAFNPRISITAPPAGASRNGSLCKREGCPARQRTAKVAGVWVPFLDALPSSDIQLLSGGSPHEVSRGVSISISGEGGDLEAARNVHKPYREAASLIGETRGAKRGILGGAPFIPVGEVIRPALGAIVAGFGIANANGQGAVVRRPCNGGCWASDFENLDRRGALGIPNYDTARRVRGGNLRSIGRPHETTDRACVPAMSSDNSPARGRHSADSSAIAAD